MLRDSKEYYRRLFNLMDDGFCIIEQVSDEPPDFCYVEVNPAFIAQSGVSNVVGKTIGQVFPDESQEWLEICDNILKTGEPQSFEVELVTQGQVLELYAFRIDKVHRRIAVISKDINHCKTMEESYRVLIENSVEMIYLHDLVGNLLEVNLAAVMHSGYSKAELLKLSVFDLNPEQSWRDDILNQWKSWPLGHRVTLTSKLRHKNGTVSPVEVTTGKILIQGEARILAFVRDITDRLAAEERLLRQGKILEGIGHFREALACDSEEDACAIYLQVAKELTDSKMGIMGEVRRKSLKDIVISRPAWDACHIKIPKGHNAEPQEREIQGLYGTIIREGKGFYTNDPPSHPDSIGTPEGHPPLTSFLGVPLLGKGEVLGMIAVANREGGYRNEDLEAMTVLSEAIVQVFMRSRAEKALRAANTELELTNRRKGDFLSILSHEIRNPLTSITMGLSLLDCVEPASPKTRQAREIMKRQAKQLTRLVDDLLVMTRLNQQKLRLKKERLELNDQICRIADEYRGMFQEKGINLRVELFAPPLYVDADEIRLTQIVGNLLHNAVKYNRKGGSALVKVSQDESQKFVNIQVEDTGIGISQEILPHLFAPYVQADASLHHGNGGLGLGLMLAKGLTELHGGEVTAHSDGLGKGSVFTVRLPLAREISQINVPQSPKELIKRSMRVLLIEDLVDVSDVLKSLLEYEGHEVMAVHTGRKGIAKARLFRPQVVFCDIGLPDIDGYQVAKAFLSDEELQDIFLISLSGYGREKDLQMAKEAGFQLQLKKPVDLTALREALILVHD